MEPRISLITLGVSDLDASRKFYCEGLGFEESESSSEGISFLKTSGAVLALYPEDELAKDVGGKYAGQNRSGFSGVTLAHNVREREQVDEVLELAKQSGGEVVKPAQDVFWGGYSGYFRDPDGHLWEVAWGAFPFNEDGSLKLD